MSNEKALLEFALKHDPSLADKFAKFERKASFKASIEKAVQSYLGTKETPSAKEVLAEIGEAFGAAADKGKTKSKGARHRTTITDDIRTKVKALAKQGKKAPTIAGELGISAPSVYNILKK